MGARRDNPHTKKKPVHQQYLKRDKGFIYVPGALLHAEMSCGMKMLMEGTIVEIIVKLDPTVD